MSNLSIFPHAHYWAQMYRMYLGLKRPSGASRHRNLPAGCALRAHKKTTFHLRCCNFILGETLTQQLAKWLRSKYPAQSLIVHFSFSMLMSFPVCVPPRPPNPCDSSHQIQFPALDIRLSYNDIELFLAIARSIPTGAAAAPEDPGAAPPAGPEPVLSVKDSFKAKTEALLGTVPLRPGL